MRSACQAFLHQRDHRIERCLLVVYEAEHVRDVAYRERRAADDPPLGRTAAAIRTNLLQQANLHMLAHRGGATHDGGHAGHFVAHLALVRETVAPVRIFPGCNHARHIRQFGCHKHLDAPLVVIFRCCRWPRSAAARVAPAGPLHKPRAVGTWGAAWRSGTRIPRPGGRPKAV